MEQQEENESGSRREIKEPDFLGRRISRRRFLRYLAVGAGCLIGGGAIIKMLMNSDGITGRVTSDAPSELWKWSKEAYYYNKLGRGVQCELCPNGCILYDGDRGVCRVRVNKGDKLYTIAYGNPCSVHIDPVEKKPLFHFLPKTSAFSIATAGCNFRCLYCQNWTISQARPEDTKNFDLFPEKVIEIAKERKCESIAYTYSEPSVFYEYMYDTSKSAKEQGIKNLWITNGYMNEKPLKDLCKYMDAANVDLKSFKNSTYGELNAGTLKPVLETLKTLDENKVWLEITNLIVPTWTDNIDMIREMCIWLKKNNLERYPLHFSRFTPMHKLANLTETPISILEKARNIAIDEGIRHVYIGNVPGSVAENTFCPKCGKIVIKREGYEVIFENFKDGFCSACGERIEGVWV